MVVVAFLEKAFNSGRKGRHSVHPYGKGGDDRDEYLEKYFVVRRRRDALIEVRCPL